MIAIDVMGGDYAPTEIVHGACLAAKAGCPVILCGPSASMRTLLTAFDANWLSYDIELVDAPDLIAMDEEPVRAVRSKPHSSLVRAIALVAARKAHGVVSAGNSGAIMAGALLGLGKCSGVDRPAIAAYVPTHAGKTLCLDLGATTDPKPSFLQQYAHMGVSHVAGVDGIVNPRVGLLANGHEASKGSLVSKQAYERLAGDASINFVGNVEPAALVAGAVDVLVTDGFSGNILLKTFEATASLYKLDPQTATAAVMQLQGGALLLGVTGTVVVAHGAAKKEAIYKAIMQAQASALDDVTVIRRRYETAQRTSSSHNA